MNATLCWCSCLQPRGFEGLTNSRQESSESRAGAHDPPEPVRPAGLEEHGVSPWRGEPALPPQPGSGSTGLWSYRTRLPEPGIFGSSGGGCLIAKNNTGQRDTEGNGGEGLRNQRGRMEVPITAFLGLIQKDFADVPACSVRWIQVTGYFKPSGRVAAKPSPDRGFAQPPEIVLGA